MHQNFAELQYYAKSRHEDLLKEAEKERLIRMASGKSDGDKPRFPIVIRILVGAAVLLMAKVVMI